MVEQREGSSVIISTATQCGVIGILKEDGPPVTNQEIAIDVKPQFNTEARDLDLDLISERAGFWHWQARLDVPAEEPRVQVAGCRHWFVDDS